MDNSIQAGSDSECDDGRKSTNMEDLFDGTTDKNSDVIVYEPVSAPNPNVIISNFNNSENFDTSLQEECLNSDIVIVEKENNVICDTKNELEPDICDKIDLIHNNILSDEVMNQINENVEMDKINHTKSARERKLSLDHTIFSRTEGLSQSELNLRWIGKKPLERKPSFFRKKMDIFLRNTTEIFKKRSSSSKSGSLQSLNCNNLKSDNSLESLELPVSHQENLCRDNNTGVVPPPIARSVSSLAVCQSGRYARQPSVQSYAGSQTALHASSNSTLEDLSNSAHSLNESFLREHIWRRKTSSRAISMNSGLDAPIYQQKKNANRSNRVTWVASEGLTNYFRRLHQDEKTNEQSYHTQQDFSRIPENEINKRKSDSKGRRLSYQRAVSGEDPVKTTRGQDSSIRRRNRIPENQESHYELANQLAEFTKNGLPQLQGFALTHVPDEVFAYIMWAESPTYMDDVYEGLDLSPEEKSRQAIIKELVNTEADYIRNLVTVVELFIATAHAIQDSGKMLAVETDRLFLNLPDVLNASLNLWQEAFMPMLKDAVQNKRPFNTGLMHAGFRKFDHIVQPYVIYVQEQSKSVDYVRSMSADPEFAMYLSWCHSHRSCNRLQLGDFLVKPMQRLTKYNLILARIINHTNTEVDRTILLDMETITKGYVLELNRTIRHREELEKIDELTASIDSYDVDFKDEEMDKYFRMFTALNLRSPMVNCLPAQSRCLIYEGDMRFKDNAKEMEVHIFILTDMMLVCKKLSKGNFPYKLIRPKYMINHMIQFSRFMNSSCKDLSALVYVIVDDVGSSYTTFSLSESSKESVPTSTLKMVETKIREARLSYDLTVWSARNPGRSLSDLELELSEYGLSLGSFFNTDNSTIEQDAKERVATMQYRSAGSSTECDVSQVSMPTDSGSSFGVFPGPYNVRHFIHRTSVASSRNSRLSSFQQSTSAASHDEPQAGPSRIIFKPSTSHEHRLSQSHSSSNTAASITVNVVIESETETVIPSKHTSDYLQPCSPIMPSSPMGTSPVRPASAQNTLRVHTQNNVQTLVHSLPDLTIEPSTPRSTSSPTRPSASEKMYQSHQELLQRNRLIVAQQQQYLSPHHRGISYPPPSPTRGSLKRGLAFSYSFKNPPLSKMGHVNSQSQAHTETSPSLSQRFRIERSKGDKGEKKKPESSSSFFTSRSWHAKLDG